LLVCFIVNRQHGTVCFIVNRQQWCSMFYC